MNEVVEWESHRTKWKGPSSKPCLTRGFINSTRMDPFPAMSAMLPEVFKFDPHPGSLNRSHLRSRRSRLITSNELSGTTPLLGKFRHRPPRSSRWEFLRHRQGRSLLVPGSWGLWLGTSILPRYIPLSHQRWFCWWKSPHRWDMDGARTTRLVAREILWNIHMVSWVKIPKGHYPLVN